MRFDCCQLCIKPAALVISFLMLPTVLADSHSWPYAPFSTSGRNIVNARNDVLHWAGVNWPLNEVSMLPEGIEWQSADTILDFIEDAGFNFIRMGYATEMIDDLYDRGGKDVPICESLTSSLGNDNGTSICHRISENNGEWNENTTRFEVWDDIIEKANSRQIYVHPDLHIDKAGWCCSEDDGDAWFDDTNFSVHNWTRALQYIANYTKQHDNMVSISLHNEPRKSSSHYLGYNWETLVGNFTHGADLIHEANPDLLITWAGKDFDVELSALTAGTPYNQARCHNCDPTDSGDHFNITEHDWGNKLVFELHHYNYGSDCDSLALELYKDGFNALGMSKPSGCNDTTNCTEAANIAPVLLTEFGTTQNEHLSDQLKCLRNFITDNGISWAMWTIGGSYRIRSGIRGYNETYGLLNYEWSDWRLSDVVNDWWKPFVNSTLNNTHT